jgi:hypothetical protein
MANTKWTINGVTNLRGSLKEELESRFPHADSGKLDRLNYIKTQILATTNSSDSQAAQKQFLYLMFALVHHEKFGGLSIREIEQYSKLCSAILITEGIVPGKSRASFLYADMQTVLSQIYRRRGWHWRAAWNQQLAIFDAKGSKIPDTSGAYLLSAANRALRVGIANIAIEQYLEALKSAEHPTTREAAHLGLAKTHRLMGTFDEARIALKPLLGMTAITENGRIEAQWEQICITCTETSNLQPMLNAVRRKGSHNIAAYIVESMFWVWANRDMGLIKHLCKVDSVRRRSPETTKKTKTFFDSAEIVEKSYDEEVPLRLRLQEMGQVVSEAGHLLSIDKELLALAACARWLERQKCGAMHELLMGKYKNISLTLSRGKRQDVLAVFGNFGVK